MSEFTIGNRRIGSGQPAFIIAELSCNHLGSLDIAKRTIRAAADAGADAVKLQTFGPESLTLPIHDRNSDFWMSGGTQWDGDSLWNLYSRVVTPREWHAELFDLARSLGMECFSTPQDHSAVDFLEQLNCPAYKIASFEANDLELISYVGKQKKPVIFATGMATGLDMIRRAVEALMVVGCSDISILKCCSAYPAKLEELHLSTITKIASEFPEIVVGLSDHSRSPQVAATAVALGAKIIECHIIERRDLKDEKGQPSPDVEFSLEPDEFKELVRLVRNTELSLGKPEAGLRLGKQQEVNLQFRRSLYVAENLKAGEVVGQQHIRAVRPGWGDDPKNLPLYIGKRAKRDLAVGTRASLNDFS